MNEEIDEYDIYHQDFTTVSEWEVFIARIEELLNEWRLTKSKKPNGTSKNKKKWIEKSEGVKFQNFKFVMSYHAQDSVINTDEKKESDDLSTELLDGIWESTKNFMDDDDGSPFPVSNWFGLKQYLMLCPNQSLTDGSLIKLVMSSINIAFANVDCSVPFFLKIRENWQQSFLGFYESSKFKTCFDTIHLKRIPNHCTNMNGLVNLFKGKIASPVSLGTVLMSAKFSYELKDLEPFLWKKPSHSNEFLSIDGFDVKKLVELPFGAEKNPIQSAMLNVIWPKFLETTVVDSSTYSDFDPLMAPTWNITIKWRDNMKCLMSAVINKLLELLENNNLLMDTLGLSRSLGLVNPLHKITEAPITISKLVKAAIGTTSVTDFKGPISDDLLMPLLYYIFPDAVDDDSFNYPPNLEMDMKQGENQEWKHCTVKSSPEGGLVWRVSLAAARLYDAGGLPYLAHLWYEFTQELLYRWEHRIFIPGILEGDPNARTCLLHQKLQLLNCCIRRAKETEGGAAAEGAANSDDDEFFDCSDEEESEKRAPWDRPVGRLERLEQATLKNGAPLYVPRTQDPAPKTEDQLEEDAELMVRLGDDARGSELRARMMSASLLSDMEAFKAANPGAELCDFCRWYSPRDWLPEGGGALGERMLLPGNPWAEAWSVARPVPAVRQRRLFDETREAERVLHYLRARTVAGAAELVLPAVLRAAAARLAAEGAPAGGAGAGGAGAGGGDARRTLALAAQAACAGERGACRARAGRAAAAAGEAGAALDAAGRARVLAAAGGALPAAPARREFSLRVRGEHAPQLMRAVLATDIKIVGAFTEPLVLL